MTTTGSSAIDFLVGNGNNDTLNGGTGSDTLTGSGGNDTFVFSTALGAGNVDAITDFDANPMGGQDHIQLSSTIFTAIGGTLESGEFVAWNSNTTPGGPAQDGNNYILFDTFTGNLYYDANATLADGMQLFAKLAVAGTVDSTDFTVGP